MSRIELNIVATGNFRSVETSIARLRSQVETLNASMMGLGFNANIGKSVSLFQDQFNSAIDTSGMFERHMVNLTTETTKFGRSLEAGNLRIGQLFRAATEYRRGELGQIRQLAREQVRLMNSTSMRMADGTTQVIVPRGIDEAIEKQRILNQEYRIFRQVVSNGSTEIINWGKNTQWAGRQLTVGLTVPLAIFGAAAGKMFMDADKQLTRLSKVYGDASKGMVDPAELQKIRQETLGLAQDIASSMGVAVEETLGIAADLAATGKEGNDLLAATNEAMRLSVLGEVDRQEAMRATISIQNVFKKDAEGLAESINFLNAVENQTSTTLNDLVTGIVKAGPVVQGLGGDVEDLAAMMVAMREGGVSASEAANAIKSSLASLINPTKQTTDVLGGFGIDIKNIVDKNAGDVIGTLTDLQSALSGLDELSRQRSIEQIFGKFQFSRINALLANLGKAGSQTQQVFAISNMGIEDLAKNADAELKAVTESVTGRFQRSFESLKASLIPIGETFVTVGTILINVGNKVLEIFNSIPDPIKNIVKGLLGATAAIGPLIMISGVLGNFFGYLIKGISIMLSFKKQGKGAFELLSVESMAAKNSTDLLSESLYDQSTAIGTMASAVDTLVSKLQELVNQLNHARSASSSMDNVAQGVLANAEAAAIVRTGPATPYTTPMIPWTKEKGRQRYTGREEAGVTYSHLTPESMLGGRGVMGIGTFVDQAASDVQKDLKNFYADIVDLREQVLTPEIRRQALENLSRAHHGTGPALEASLAKIRALSDEQLAQLLPSWEKISAQSAEYFAILSVSAEKIEAGNKEVATAFKKYGLDIESGRDPLASLDELRSAVNGAEGAVDKKVLEITQEFNKIEQELASMPAGPERATRTAELIKQRIVDPYEVASVDALRGAGVKGMGERGLRDPLVQAIQMYTDQIFNDAESSREVAAALATGNQELIESTLRLAQARQKEAQASEEKIAAEEQYQLAAKQESDARAAYAKAQRDSAQALLRYGPNSTQYKAAKQKEYQAQQDVVEAEVKLATASERKRVSILNSTRASSELSEEELQLAALRERQSQEIVENIVSTQRNTDETNQGTLARDGQTGAILGNTNATSKNSGGFLRGGKLGTALSFASMAALFLPRPGEDTGAGQAMNAGINIANMAGMGAMFGGPGIAIGAGIGAAIEGIGFLGRKAEETALEIEKYRASSEALRTGLTELERSFFDVKPLAELENLPLGAFNLRTQEATDKLREFARAVEEAEPGSVEASRRDLIAGMSSAEEFINSPMFSKMISEALLGGMDIENIKTMVGGYLDAANKENFAPIINSELDRIGKLGTKPEEIGARYLADLENIADRVISGAGYSSSENIGLRGAQQRYEEARAGREILVYNETTNQDQQANLADMTKYLQGVAETFGVTLEDLMNVLIDGTVPQNANLDYLNQLQTAAGMAGEQIKIGGDAARNNTESFRELILASQELYKINPELNNISEVMGAIGNESQLMAQGLFSALAAGPKTFDEFINSLGATANTLQNNKSLMSEVGVQLSEMSEDAGRAFDMMMKGGVDLQDALRIVSMVIADVNTDWAALADMARANPADFYANVWMSFMQGSPVGTTPTAQGAANPENAIQSALGAIDYSGGGSSGGSDYYDKLIEAQDKIIEGIQKEREERQKLLDIQEKQMDFALRRQDLENQIARALAEGNLAEAALLQAELDSEQNKYDREEQERKRQEREDKRIKAAEKEKERLQKLKDASSGGGGGAGGVSESQKQWTANRVEILTSGVVNWTEGAELRARTAVMGPWSAFFESDKVRQYRQELEKLNIPAENIDAILNDLFDSWIDNNNQLFAQTDDYKFIESSLKNMGIEGDRLKEIMPDIFGAILDKELNPKEKIDIIAGALYDLGYETDEAYRKAKRLYDKYGEDFDGKGIDEEVARWVEWNDIILKAGKRLDRINKQLSEGATISDLGLSADRLDEISRTAAGQSTAQVGPTFNAGGVMLTGEQIGSDLMAGVGRGLTNGVQAEEAAARMAIGWFEKWMRSETKTESPSLVYELLGKDMIAGLINGLVLPPDSGKEIISSMTDTFKSAVDSYSIMFTHPINGIAGVMDAEVKTASDKFYETMTVGMQNTVDEINNILKTNLKDYTFQIIGDPKIYTGGAPDIWTKVFGNLTNIFTDQEPIRRAKGGYVSGPGGPTEDKIPALLSDGEYVIKASSVNQYGTELLDMINARKFATGGYASADRAEYNASRRPTYFGGTPTSSTGYNTPAPTYYGGTPTYTGGYTSAYIPTTNAPRPTGPADELNIAYTGSGLISYGGGNYAWDTTKGKYVKLSDVKTGTAASGFALMAQGINESVNKYGFWSMLGMMASHIKENPEELIPFVGSSRIDTSTQEGKDMFAASSLLDIISIIPGMTGAAALIKAARTSIKYAKSPSLAVANAQARATAVRSALSISSLKKALAATNIGSKRTGATSISQTGTKNSRNIVAKDYTDMLDISKKDIEEYVQIAYPLISDEQKAYLVSKIFDESGKLRTLDVIDNNPYVLDPNLFPKQQQTTYLKSGPNSPATAVDLGEVPISPSSQPGVRKQQIGLGALDILRDTSQVKRLKTVYDDLVNKKDPSVQGLSFEQFVNKTKQSSVAASNVSSVGEIAASQIDQTFVSAVNRSYAKNIYGLDELDLIRLYKGVSSNTLAGNTFKGYSSTDPNVAKFFAQAHGSPGVTGNIIATDLPVGKLPQVIGATGWADEFAQFIPESAGLKSVVPSGINPRYSSSTNRSWRSYDAQNALFPKSINKKVFEKNKESIVAFANSIGLDPFKLISGSGFRKVGDSWILDISRIGSMPSKNKQLLKYMEDELGIGLVSLKTGDGLVPYRINPINKTTPPIPPIKKSKNNTRSKEVATGLGLSATAPVLGGWFGGLDNMLSMATSPGGLAAMGLGAAALSPLGRRILTMPYHAIRNRDILKHAIHINNSGGAFLMEHPRDIPVKNGRLNGPGAYFSDDRLTGASDMFRKNNSKDPRYALLGRNPDFWIRPYPGKSRTALMTGWKRWGKTNTTGLRGNNKLRNQSWDSKVVQKMRKRGIVGVHAPGYSTIFDFGVPGEWGYRPIDDPARSTSLSSGITPYARAAASIISKSGSIGIPPAALWYLMNNYGMFADGGLVRVGKENLTVLGEGISNYAKRFVETPYSSSAAWEDGPANGWGCATATKWLYDSYAGVDLGHPSLSAAQYASDQGSKVSNMLPGDLLYFYYKNGVNTQNPINHTGMYIGGESMFHARSEALGTQITGIDEAGMDRARTRAGGTAIKRYLPLTIAGMGLPTAQFRMGGEVYGKGGPTSDDILALISNGEYVMNAGAVRHYGKEFMDAVNKGILPEAAMGGMFSSKYPGVVQKMAGGGMLMSKYGKGGMVSSSANVEYNINVNVAGSNASPDEIANKVMQTLKRSEKMKGATIRI